MELEIFWGRLFQLGFFFAFAFALAFTGGLETFQYFLESFSAPPQLFQHFADVFVDKVRARFRVYLTVDQKFLRNHFILALTLLFTTFFGVCFNRKFH